MTFGSSINPNHRKVAAYVNYAGKTEYETSGHGTHVAGSIAGKAHNQAYATYDVFIFHK